MEDLQNQKSESSGQKQEKRDKYTTCSFSGSFTRNFGRLTRTFQRLTPTFRRLTRAFPCLTRTFWRLAQTSWQVARTFQEVTRTSRRLTRSFNRIAETFREDAFTFRLLTFPSRRSIRHGARRGCTWPDEGELVARLSRWLPCLAKFPRPVAGWRGHTKMPAPKAVAI